MYEHLKDLPDGSLTRREVAILVDAANAAEREVSAFGDRVRGALLGFGGFLRCETCGTTLDLGDPGEHVSLGWPSHCGYTMRWWTQSQIDAGEVPEIASR